MKKIIITALAFASFTSISANARPAAPAPVPNAFGPYIYVGGEAGWARSDWSDFTGLVADDAGAVFGGKLGYQATRHLGAEIGGFVLPKSDQTAWANLSSAEGTVKSWVGYAAATFRMPLFKNERLYLRAKAGPAYRSLQHSGVLYDTTDVGTGHYWTAILGASLNYAFSDSTHPVIIGVEYSNIFGSSDSWSSNGVINANAAPSVQIVAATLSVAFRV